jgi:histone H2B
MRPSKGGNIGQQGGKSKGAAFAATSGGYGAAGAIPVAPGGGKRATIIPPTADHGGASAAAGSSRGGSEYSGAARSATASRRRAARREGGGGSIASKSQRSKGGAYPADAASASRHSGATSARRKAKRGQPAHGGVPVANVNRRGKRKPAWRRWASYLAFLNKRSKRPSLSKRAVAIIGSFVEDMFETITMQGSAVARMNNRKTVQAKEIETAVRLILPEELSRIALAEGTRALTKYNASLVALKEADDE